MKIIEDLLLLGIIILLILQVIDIGDSKSRIEKLEQRTEKQEIAIRHLYRVE